MHSACTFIVPNTVHALRMFFCGSLCLMRYWAQLCSAETEEASQAASQGSGAVPSYGSARNSSAGDSHAAATRTNLGASHGMKLHQISACTHVVLPLAAPVTVFSRAVHLFLQCFPYYLGCRISCTNWYPQTSLTLKTGRRT